MSLQQQITEDYKIAFKGKTEEYSTYTLIRAALKQVEIDERKELTDDDVITILKKEAKKRVESIEQYKQAGRENLVQQEEKELAVIKKYLPEAMPEEEIKKIAEGVIAEMNPTPQDFGKVMGAVMGKTKGQADGSTAQKIVKELLG